jgi:hypothetical protein
MGADGGSVASGSDLGGTSLYGVPGAIGGGNGTGGLILIEEYTQ